MVNGIPGTPSQRRPVFCNTQWGKNQEQQNQPQQEPYNMGLTPEMVIQFTGNPHAHDTHCNENQLLLQVSIRTIPICNGSIIAGTENHHRPENDQKCGQADDNKIPGFNFSLWKFFHVSNPAFYQEPRRATHSLKWSPRCSKFLYMSQLAQAGDSSTVSPASAMSLAFCTHSFMSFA